MLVVDDKTMVLGGVAILLALLSPIVNALILKLKVGKSDIDGSSLPVNDVSLPGISVVMTVDDEGEDLKKNLPQWLDQSYGGKYQVIVVVRATTLRLSQSSSDIRVPRRYTPLSSRLRPAI